MHQLSPHPSAPSDDPEPTLVRPPRDFREPGSAPRWRIGVGAVVVAVIVLLGVGVVFSAVSSAGAEAAGSVGTRANPSSASASASAGAEPSRSSTASPSDGTVFVHILGQIAHPGLYEVAPDARAVDVVTAAGGFTAAADQAALNLARPVVDGEQIVVPKPGEAPAPTAPAAGSTGQSGASGSGAGGSSPAGAPVDLNTADATALQALPGVGPATAQAILDWRAEHSRFESVDDLLDVTGIGDKKLERLRDSVTVR